MRTGERLNQLLNNPKILTPPAVALRVLEQVGRPECSLAEIRDIIRHDPALCGLILKTLNSILFSLSHAVTSIEQALLLLGLGRVRSLVLTLYLPAIRNVGRSSPQLRHFWRSSVIGAILARELALRIGRPDPESDLLAGLLRDMGKLILLQLHPEDYSELLMRYEDRSETDLCDHESLQFGFNHCHVSASLLQRWRLPDSILKAVGNHHHPERATEHGDGVLKSAAFLHFASLASEFLINPQIPGLRRELLNRAQVAYSMDEGQLVQFLAPLGPKVKELGALLNVEVGNEVDYAKILQNANDELVKLNSTLEVSDAKNSTPTLSNAEQSSKADRILKALPSRDDVTGLPDRRLFLESATAEYRRLKRRYGMLGVMVIDLDDYKDIHAKYGQAFADQVLKEFTVALKSSIRSTDATSRIGEDQFCALLRDVPESAFKLIGERLVHAVQKMELYFGRHLCSVSAEIGIAYCLPYSGNGDVDQLLETAIRAAALSKKQGKYQTTVTGLFSVKDREIKDTVERRSFRAFLIRRNVVTETQLFQAGGSRSVRICLQRIARKLNWISRQEACELTRIQRVLRRPFGEIALQQGYLKQPDLWVLFAIQQENPEHLARQIVAAGLLGSREMTDELEAYYLMIGSRGGSAHGSQVSSGSRLGLSTKSSGSQPGFHSRPASGSRLGFGYNSHKNR